MDMTTVIQLSAIPSTLVMLGGLLVLFHGSPEKAGKSFLLYLLAPSALSGLIVSLGSRYWKMPYGQADFTSPIYSWQNW